MCLKKSPFEFLPSQNLKLYWVTVKLGKVHWSSACHTTASAVVFRCKVVSKLSDAPFVDSHETHLDLLETEDRDRAAQEKESQISPCK